MPAEMSVERDAQRRRYAALMFVEVLLLLASWRLAQLAASREWVGWLFGLLGVWHVAVIPICLLYLLRRPVVMTLAPLIPSAESRSFRKRLRQRRALDDDEFYRRFYAGSEVSAELIVGLRRCVAHIDTLIDRAVPFDRLHLLDDELDFGDLVWLVEREFGIRFTEGDWDQLDGTPDNLIRMVHQRSEKGARTILLDK